MAALLHYRHKIRLDNPPVRRHETEPMYPRCSCDRAVGRVSKTAEHRNFRGDFVRERENTKCRIRLHIGKELIEPGLKDEPAFALQNRNFEQAEGADRQGLRAPCCAVECPDLLAGKPLLIAQPANNHVSVEQEAWQQRSTLIPGERVSTSPTC
jgi:hypothetical protein